MRWGRVVAVLVVVGLGVLLAAIVASWVSDRNAGETGLSAAAASPALIARGAYLARLGDCAACHSIAGMPALSGGLRMAIPIGAIYSTNITPDSNYGIGRFTLLDFDRALRFGVSNGHTLYPAMPFASYYNLRPEDVAALYAYLEYGVPAASIPNREADIVFPLSMRWPLTFWRWFFAPRPKPFVPRLGMTPVVGRGAYFVEGLGHCGECHTPRALTLQLKAQTAADGPNFLSGAVIENYFAPSLRNDGPGSLGDWSEAELAQFLQTGANSHGIAFGSMGDVVIHSTQFMTLGDAKAAAAYLKTIGESGAPPSRFAYDDTEHRALKSGDATKPGALLYLDNCAACHRPDGMGYVRVFPKLAGNPVVQATNPLSLVSIVLSGSATPKTGGAPAQFSMPGFSWRLSDNDVADVVNFIRSSWGNSSSMISPSDVGKWRQLMPRPVRSGAAAP